MGILRICLDKLLRDKAFNFAKIPKCYGYQRSLTSMIYEFLGKGRLSLVVLQIKICQTKI